MRVLLDECVPVRLRHEFIGHDVETAHFSGFGALPDGEMLTVVAGRYDVFVTVDGNLAHQQSLTDLPFIVVVLRSPSNDLDTLRQLVPAALNALAAAAPGDLAIVSEADL